MEYKIDDKELKANIFISFVNKVWKGQYDIENPEDRHHRQHHASRTAEIPGFCYAEDKDNGKTKTKIYPPPHVPSSFVEKHVFSKPLDWSWVINKGSINTLL